MDLLRLIKLDDEAAFARIRRRLDVPREHLVALHAGDLAVPAHGQRQAGQFALHHLAVHQRRLSHQAGAEADLR